MVKLPMENSSGYISSTPLKLFSQAAVTPESDQENSNPDDDCRISQVKNRWPNCKIEEINHINTSDTVDQVTQGTTQHQGKAKPQPAVSFCQKAVIIHYHERYNDGDNDKKSSLVWKHTESSPWIADIGYIKKIVNYCNRLPYFQGTGNHILAQLVQSNYGYSNQDKTQIIPPGSGTQASLLALSFFVLCSGQLNGSATVLNIFLLPGGSLSMITLQPAEASHTAPLDHTYNSSTARQIFIAGLKAVNHSPAAGTKLFFRISVNPASRAFVSVRFFNPYFYRKTQAF